jgi:hypothetical protein
MSEKKAKSPTPAIIPLVNLPSGVAAEAPWGVHLGKIGLITPKRLLTCLGD